LIVRKIAAASGLANRVRKVCSSSSPVMPTGIVPITSSQASRSSLSRATIRRSLSVGPRVRNQAEMMRTQSLRKKINNATAVPTCSATMNERYGLASLSAVEDWVTSCSQLPPNRAGTSTEWPRLEIGNSSVTPCNSPSTAAWT
jgi:hypothetical protein